MKTELSYPRHVKVAWEVETPKIVIKSAWGEDGGGDEYPDRGWGPTNSPKGPGMNTRIAFALAFLAVCALGAYHFRTFLAW